MPVPECVHKHKAMSVCVKLIGGILDKFYRNSHHFIVIISSETKLAPPIRALSFYNS